MLINDIKKNEDKIFKQDDFGEFVIQSSDKPIALLDIVKLILQFNERIRSDLKVKCLKRWKMNWLLCIINCQNVVTHKSLDGILTAKISKN